MLELIKRCPEFMPGYKAYCQEFYDKGVVFFRPTPPRFMDDNWFIRTKPVYDRKEIDPNPGKSPSFHYWAVDGNRFVGEFQLRTQFTEDVMTEIGSIGYAVRVSEWGKGYGTKILQFGLELAKNHGMDKVLLTINDQNKPSIHICEKLGGQLVDTIDAYNEAEGSHKLRRYWIYL
jgi:predicted acetyltransferase